MTNDAEILEILRAAKTIAVVGLSSKKMRPSYGVASFLQDMGYRIVPVNPTETEVLGEKAYPSLQAVPGRIDVVNVFRRPDAVPAVVEDAIAVKAPYLWLQEGVIHAQAAQRARDSGMKVVMDRCILKEHRRLMR